MEKTTWNAYKNFRCIAEKCPDSCCKGWEVDVDETAAAYYRSLEGDLGDRLRQVLKTENGAAFMELENGRCPMWRQDGLCRIQAEEYPRLYMDFGDFAEWGLEMSCPEAAKLLFADISAGSETITGGEEPEYDAEVMAILKKSRGEVLSFWEQLPWDIPQMLAATLLYAHQVQGAIDGREYAVFVPQNYLAAAKQYAAAGDMRELVGFYQNLEILTEDWKNRLHSCGIGSWDSRLRSFAVYLIRRYWLQAVWDFDLVCRVKFIVAACILVNALGGDTVQTAQLFSKEIENDPDNREAILDAAYTHPAFTDANLLGLLGCV